MSAATAAYLFVRGTWTSDVERLVVEGQTATALDTIERLRAIHLVDQIVAATHSESFAARAAELGAVVDMDPAGEFHFGRRLVGLCGRYPAQTALYVGGGSGALMTGSDWRNLLQLARRPGALVPNNYYSCDFAAWSPGSAVDRIEPPPLDNDLAFRLGERGGLELARLPKTAATQFDIDTPLDLMIAARHPQAGPRVKAYAAGLGLDNHRLAQVTNVMRSPKAKATIIGRVSGSLAALLERATKCEWRVLSEERGMRASGREERGEVRSVVGFYYEQVGGDTFFSTLARIADAAIVDSRVLFAHLQRHPSKSDRFQSDLLNAEPIQDPVVKEFTSAAARAEIPVLLGGHSLVSGGMFALVESVKERDA